MLLVILITVGFWATIWGALFGIPWLLWAGLGLLGLGIIITERLYHRGAA